MKSLLAVTLVLFSLSVNAQETAIQGTLEWERMEFNATVSINLQRAGIRLPAGRSQAEAMLENEFSEEIRPFIVEIQADSSSTVADLINRGELSTAAFMGKVRSLPPALSPDQTSIFARYSIALTGISAELIRHSRPQSISAPLIPVPARNYTGIIIIADEALPVHGRSESALALPCLFPKIWDSEMNLIYERNMIDPSLGRQAGMVRYVSRENIMRSAPSSMDQDLINRVGENPLQIMARGLFGIVPTDPIIDREDALLILSSEHNRQLLMEGRVALVLNRQELRRNIP